VTGDVLEADFSLRVDGGPRPFEVSVQLPGVQGISVLFGPSGAGKSLTLQVLAGVRPPSRGHARLQDTVLFDLEQAQVLPAHQRRLGFIPQQQNLFPFCNVFQNVAFGLPRSERHASNPRLKSLMEELGIASLAQAMPAQLSGGERQRVALARALAVRPRLLLLDEPFASIDYAGRQAMYPVLKSLLERHNTPALLVTHDPEEARAMGDQVIPFERGRTLPPVPAARFHRPELS